MQATATTVSTRVNQPDPRARRGRLMAFVLGAALALAATGTFAGGDSAAPRRSIERRGAADVTSCVNTARRRSRRPPAVVDAALLEHVMRENGAR